MIAFGQYENVNHARDIFPLFLIQSGNPIVGRTDTGYRLSMKDNSSDGSSPIQTILDFFLEFSNPSKDIYTWNRSMPNSLDMFTSGKLAFYIGYASELFNIQDINPNLSFDVKMIPQTKGSDFKSTYGEMYTLVASKKSKNLTSALGVATMIASPDFLKELSISTSLPPTLRSLLSDKPEDSHLLTFFDSAIVARSWLNPDRENTDSIFRELMNSALSNKLSTGDSVNKAYNQLELSLRKNYEK
jgi:ABC-type glycerol-3-phosphate transport system substrate-binding protein